MARNIRLIDQIRRSRSAAQNQLIDELAAGYIGRRDFLRHGSVLGMSLALRGTVLGAFGYAVSSQSARAATQGGTLRIGLQVPTEVVDPVTAFAFGAITMIAQTGEYLCMSGPDLNLKPMLAESWSPNEDGTVWTFKIRQGVLFHNGQTMTVDDVVATFERLVDPANGSNALATFDGVLSLGGTQAVDDTTVAFHLDAPNGNFPYYVSSENYNSVILPAGYANDFQTNFVGTGPYRLDSYVEQVGASFVRNDDYWGQVAYLDRTEFSFYADMQPQILALQGNQLDVVNQISLPQGVGLLTDPNVNVISLKSSAHEAVHMRCDTAPFTDKRVRRALALCLEREKIVNGLFRGRADMGNDSPFAPVFPPTDPSVPQRERDLAEAKQLLEAAGMPDGFTIKLTSQRFAELPDYSVLIQNAVKEIGVTLEVELLTQDAYYGEGVPGQSNWLDSTMGMTDYGHRGVPNVLLAAPLKSDGPWNSAHFQNKDYDGLVDNFVRALDLQTQRAVAHDIQELLLDETPVIYGYFYDYLTATAKNVAGVQPAATGQLFLGEASLG